MDFDDYLKKQLDEAPLPDRGFTQAVMARVERHRRRRRLAIAFAIAVAAAIAVLAMNLAPALSFTGTGTELIVAALVLMTICSLAWIETESLSPPRGGERGEGVT